MPRLPTSRILRAYRKDPFLPLLLRECRTLDSAQTEFRWLEERAIQQSKAGSSASQSGHREIGWRSWLRSMCRRRAKGLPLQYILGDQPFGDLQILCRRGVLIPRPETESYTFHLANLILDDMKRHRCGESNVSELPEKPLRILDLCSGTGCISLLLHALLAPRIEHLIVLGVDISATAVSLARRNLEHNLRLGLLSFRAKTEVMFRQADVLIKEDTDVPGMGTLFRDKSLLSTNLSEHGLCLEKDLSWDVLICNPPYISSSSFRNGTTARSVRIYEPKLALVPPCDINVNNLAIGGVASRQEDIFYPRLLSLSFEVRAKFTILECGDLAQAQRVIMMAKSLAAQLPDCNSFVIDIWRSEYEEHHKDAARAVIIKKV